MLVRSVRAPLRWWAGAVLAFVFSVGPITKSRGEETRPVAEAKGQQEFLVAGSFRALDVWSVDGQHVRTVSPRPSLFPIRTGPESIVTIEGIDDGTIGLSSESEGDGEGILFRETSLLNGKRQLLARLPHVPCGEDSDEGQFDTPSLLSPSDLIVDRQHGVVCLSLYWPKKGERKVRVDVTFDLKTKQARSASHWLGADYETGLCTIPKEIAERELEGMEGCREVRREHEEAKGRQDKDLPFPYDLRHGQVRPVALTEGPRTNGPGGHSEPHAPPSWELHSPSGRWILVSAKQAAKLPSPLLFDRSTGHFFPLPKGPGPWPKAEARIQRIKPTKASPFKNREDVRWLPGHLAPDILIVDALAIAMGGRSIDTHEGIIER